MTAEADLSEACKSFEMFERAMEEKEGLSSLRAALDYALDLVESDANESIKQQARNITNAYQRSFRDRAIELLRDTSLHGEKYEHYYDVARAFSQEGLENSDRFLRLKADLAIKAFEDYFKQLDRSEKEKIIQKLSQSI